MKKLGKYLKENREKQKLSLEDVASRTKIHIQKLVAIESGDKESLPAPVFCIGLIKSYARELKVDMSDVDRLCAEAFEVSPETSPEPTSTSEIATKVNNDANDEPRMVGRFQVPKAVVVAASGLLSLVLLFSILQIVEKMNSYSQEEALPKEVFSIDDDDFSKDKESSKIEADLNDLSDQKISDSLSGLEKKDNIKVEIENVEEPAQVTSAAPKKVTPSGEDFSDDNFGDAKKDPKPPKEKTTVVVSDNKLVLTALEPVRAEVIWSDGYVQVMLLKGQETKTLVFSQPITLRVNNGGAIQVSFNESEKTVPGSFNKPIEITYP